MDGRSSGSFSTEDTIVAVATPPGRGAIGVVRLSGRLAERIAAALLGSPRPLEPRIATVGCLARGREGILADEVVVTYFASPRSYTGEDVVEISAHGNPLVLAGIVEAAILEGARPARPGEFTLRSYLNGKRDLIRAEAVADLIAAVTPIQARVAFDQLQGTLTSRIAAIDSQILDLVVRLEASLDFPEEGYHFVERDAAELEIAATLETVRALISDGQRGRVLREGARVVISGRANVGKSLLFNSLLGYDRSIVSMSAGTTRDMVTESASVGGIPLELVDTAGPRPAVDSVEAEGIERAAKARLVADLVVLVLDCSEDLDPEDHLLLDEVPLERRLVVANKADRPVRWRSLPSGDQPLLVSALRGDGLAELRVALAGALTGCERPTETPAITNLRHIALLKGAEGCLQAARRSLALGTPEEFVLTDLQAARRQLEEISGHATSDDVLTQIFERFCVGK